ncbi:transporter substrate-binding domain-containing protein [Caloranaerobacter azorensis]|uniref:Transporter substrate-binding domain-containing protein n=1 Tax=Caloranaerobacter azorensis TaxID=116090 RepID=A0A6P1YDQ9_9FIRM|nr:transporter substrate-binding domain-containing protein [Caloranaerobacter azorensis]QIB26883.1 transporter substrate-binding domain-containing protein [Caloranaerobacter azorensis]
MLKKNIAKLIAILLIIPIILSLSGCSQKTELEKKESKLTSIKKTGKIIIGTSADFPPYEFHKEINKKDEIVGFDISIAKEIAKDIGVKLEIKDMSFDGLLAALQAGKIDFVIAGMNPTEERKKKVDFSKVYYTTVQGIIVRAEDKDKIKSLEDLKDKIIGVQKGSIQEKIAKKQITGSKIKAIGKVSDLILQLKNNKIDALIVEESVGKAYISKNKDLKLLDIKIKSEDDGFAVAVKKGNTDLLEAINNTLDRLINDKSIEKFIIEATELAENK